MNYYILDTAGDLNNRDYCFIDSEPYGIPKARYAVSHGERATGNVPVEQDEIEFRLGEDNPGLVLASLLGNVGSYLLLNKQVISAIKELNLGDLELFQFILLNHKGKIHSKDYCIVNPVGDYDCLNKERSIFKYSSTGKLIRIKKMVFNKQKLERANDLFRLHDKPNRYLVSEKFKDTIEVNGFSNFLFEQVETD